MAMEGKYIVEAMQTMKNLDSKAFVEEEFGFKTTDDMCSYDNEFAFRCFMRNTNNFCSEMHKPSTASFKLDYMYAISHSSNKNLLDPYAVATVA